ncbi:hypothetical protein BSR28_08125 [Boudabousia liubingyangii]|uniref:ribonuclease HII n=1 Tax=Boudabousia liubingyangii TaxID=1921764 RepID=UPI00093C40A4|nr:ribonuclease HII [Boudabousia liubingyangii]OKL46478.1 hypothetical protein BSR28_08125 [Boudabousia liubingyangii]
MNLDADLDLETELLKEYSTVCGIDEVGRGALAGPLYLGLCLVDRNVTPPPQGLKDSKCLTPKRRESLVAQVQSWSLGHALGIATVEEIDTYGLSTALQLAAFRGINNLLAQGFKVEAVLLDGIFDFITPKEQALLSLWDVELPEAQPHPMPRVLTVKKGDLKCASIAGASVLAKVARDKLMCELEDPGYDWSSNKGYASAKHIAAIGQLGLSPWHRKSWKIPGVTKSEERRGHES